MANSDENAKVVARERIKPREGLMRPSEGRKWRKAQVPYPNFAGMDQALDDAAATFVTDRCNHFRSRMSGPMRRWAINWGASNTEVFWHEHEDDIHMPETKKALDNKVSRVEEGVTQFDPVFEVQGIKSELDRRTAKTLGSYIYRQFELARWKDFVQPCARDGELCNIQALKVFWEEVEETVVERHDEVEYDDDGLPVFTPIRKMRKAITRRGPRIAQVDPFWFVYDLEASCVDDCAYIGDESEVFVHDLIDMAEQGVYSMAKVNEAIGRLEDGGSRTEYSETVGGPLRDHGDRGPTDQLRGMRSIALSAMHAPGETSKDGAQRIRVVEMWAWFNFRDGYDGAVDPLGKKLRGMQKVVITLANGIPIRIQQNPYDRKFAPYAFVQINRTGHEMVAPAPFDSVVQMNANYDRLSSNIMRWMDLAVSPIIVTNDLNTDLPDSIMEVEPGAVLKNTGQWDFIKVPDVTGSVSYFHGFFRNEMEELSGSLRVYESRQDTATEVERKVQEQQRMVRNSIRAAGELWRQVAILFKNLNYQFMVGSETFAVVGKASQSLGRMATITPQMMGEDADFRFIGLADLHTFGNQAAGMAQFMNMWGPMLPTVPDVNLPRMMRQHFELLVGHRGTQEIFPDDNAPWEAWSQVEENEQLLRGLRVDVNRNDDDEQHLRELAPLLRKMVEDKAPRYLLGNVVEHFNAHAAQLQRKQVEERSQMQQMERRQRLRESAAGVPGEDRPPEPGGMQSSNGITPGPEQARTVARTGREGAGLSQTQAMAQ